MREMATTDHAPPNVLAELREARAAAKRLGVDVVQRGPGGQWRAATLTPTERRRHRVDALLAERAADRRVRLARAIVAHADNEATAARRARLAKVEREIGARR